MAVKFGLVMMKLQEHKVKMLEPWRGELVSGDAECAVT